MKNTNNDKQNHTDAPSEQGGRRRFLGVGAKAAPFVLTLASQPALGVQCFTPSRSLSKNTSLSRGRDGECLRIESPGNYKTHQTPGETAYHWPQLVPPSTVFHRWFARGSSSATNFTISVPGVGERDMTFGEVLTIGANQDTNKVAKHLIGAYLNTMGGNGAVIPTHIMTPDGVRGIWAAYIGTGFEVNGKVWTGKQIVEYLVNNNIVK